MNYTGRNQNINIYLNEIRSAKSLTREKEAELFERIAKGDRKAETDLFMSMSKLAVAVAKTFTGNAELLEDCIQNANMGVVIAIRKFDITKGFRFSSYARWWMKEEVLAGIDEDQIIRVKTPEISRKVRLIRVKFFKENHREPTEYEVMDILEQDGTIVTDLNQLHDACFERLDDMFEVGDDKSTETRADAGSLAGILAASNDSLTREEMEEKKDEIRRRMSILNEREKKFVSLSFGLGAWSPMDYETIARREEDETGKSITSERVRQIVTGSVKKMRTRSAE